MKNETLWSIVPALSFNMKTNVKTRKPVRSRVTVRTCAGTGAIAADTTKENLLRRVVLTCLLGESIAYEGGETVKTIITNLIPQVRPEIVSAIAIEARTQQKLRHVPLFIVREMCRHKTHLPYVADTLEAVIQRADELSEFLAIYWKDGKQPIANQAKLGLARAFKKFDEYALAKYQNSGDIKLRDVLFLTHPSPNDRKQGKLWKRLVEKELATPDTWEVELSQSKDKKASWTRLLTEGKLGILALLRNLRNMELASVDSDLIRKALNEADAEWALPFRFISAAKHAARFEPELESAMFRCLEKQVKLKGKTALIIDVSGSMGARLSSKSELSRLDAAVAIAMLLREVCEDIVIYTTAGSDSYRKHDTRLIPARRGFGLRDTINQSASTQGGGGIFLKQCTEFVHAKEVAAERVIVISDSQDTDVNSSPQNAAAFGKRNYLMDISCEPRGIAYNRFCVINGFSEALVQFVQLHEKIENFLDNGQKTV